MNDDVGVEEPQDADEPDDPGAGQMVREEPGPGQVSVWDFPLPPVVRAESRRLRVYLGGIPIADTTTGLKVLERGLPPTMYLPRATFRHVQIVATRHRTVCEHRGEARYYTLIAGGKIAHRGAWAYSNPRPGYNRLLGFLAVHPGKMDRTMIDGEIAEGIEDDLVAGWISSDIVGPFRGRLRGDEA